MLNTAKLSKNSSKTSNKNEEPQNLVSDDEDEAAEYEVEKVVDKRMKGDKAQYLLKWKNYPASANTWEPEENIMDPSLIATYEKKNANLLQKSIKTPKRPSLAPKGKRNTSASSKTAGTSSASSNITDTSSATSNISVTLSSFSDCLTSPKAVPPQSSSKTSDKAKEISRKKEVVSRKRVVVGTESSDDEEPLQKLTNSAGANLEVPKKLANKAIRSPKTIASKDVISPKNTRNDESPKDMFSYDDASDGGGSTGFVPAIEVEEETIINLIDDNDDDLENNQVEEERVNKAENFSLKVDVKGKISKESLEMPLKTFGSRKKITSTAATMGPGNISMEKKSGYIILAFDRTNVEQVKVLMKSKKEKMTAAQWISYAEARTDFTDALLDFYEKRAVWTNDKN